jgi:hypothetical protein
LQVTAVGHQHVMHDAAAAAAAALLAAAMRNTVTPK